MSILTSIVQAIAQAICWILPISETAHSSMFHDFANRFSGACSSLTGVVHIGIALGIVLAMTGYFLKLAKEFFGSIGDMAHKKFSIENSSPARSLMLKTLLSFISMLLWLIPCGKSGLLFSVLKTTQSNMTLLDDGIFLALTGGLMLLSNRQVLLAKNNKNITELPAVIVGVASVLLVPVSGLSLVAGSFAILMLFGVSKKIALRYGFVLSVPVLVVMGIIEICTSVTKIGIAQIIIAVLISAALSFVLTRLFKTIVNKLYLKYFGIYDISVGIIISIVGIFELALR